MLTGYVQWREGRLVRRDDPYRLVEPMDCGLELVVEDARVADPLEALRDYSLHHLARSDRFFEPDESAAEFVRDGDWLTFNSPIVTETPVNNRAVCRVFETTARERAVVLLPHWNASGVGYDRFAWILRQAGMTVVRMSLPYHDSRRAEGQKRATGMVSANLGRTLRSSRQAVLEARLAIGWLHEQGYRRIGVVGVSLGSSIASIAAAHDPRVRAAALILMASHFADVVWNGRATQHIRQALDGRLTLAQLNELWSPISPSSYIARIAERRTPTLVLSARDDTVFHPTSTERYVAALRELGVPPRWRVLPCGHYTMGTFPFAIVVLRQVVRFLREHL